jgi:RNA-dependent RNA polymerase
MRGLLQLRTKCNILVEKAARVLGVVDEYGILKENEVYCIVSVDGESREILQTESGNVMITRNPCLHPGDIRTPTIVSDNEVK